MVTANVSIRGIFTSDIKYTVQTLPKEMQMKLTKEKDWFSQYAWFEYPHQFEQQENTNQISNKSKEEQKTVKSNLKQSKSKEKKSVTFHKKKEKKNEDLV